MGYRPDSISGYPMSIKIELISFTSVLWKPLQTTTQLVMDRSITKSLDAKKIPISLPSYLCALGEFLSEDCDPIELLREPGFLLSFINIGFLIIGDQHTLINIMSESDLKIIMTESKNSSILIGICNASLLQWRTGIINSCSPVTTYLIREFYNQVLTNLDALGFSKTFEHYSRKRHKDGTILLQLK